MKVSLLLAVLVFLFTGCKKDEGPPGTPIDTVGNVGQYGAGTLYFTADSAGGQFLVNGKYKPSDQFATDSLSEGAGGFIRDTSLFQREIGAMLAGYTHHLFNGTLNERWVVITLHGDSGVVAPGDYPFAPSNAAQNGRGAYFYFALSDSVTFHDIYVSKSGTLNLSSFNASTRHLQGTFAGTFWGPFPDTLRRIEIRGGGFDISAVGNYYFP
jgi:hypothetical protein